MTGGKWLDTAGKPDPMQAVKQGFEGAFVYVGTPGSPKNCTTAYYGQLVAAGLAVIAVVEHNQHDAELGTPAGTSYAEAGLVDMASMGFASDVPLGVTADEHLTAGQIPTAVEFQAAASQIIRTAGRLAMGYGFAEFIHALRPDRLVDIEWQSGSRSLVDSETHFWQDNTGTEQVGPVTVDRDWKFLEVIMTTPAAIWGYQIPTTDGKTTFSAFDWLRYADTYAAQSVASLATVSSALTAIATALAATDADVKAAATQEAANHAADLTAVAKVGSIDPATLETALHTALTALGWTPPPTAQDIAAASSAVTAPAVLALIAAKLGGAA